MNFGRSARSRDAKDKMYRASKLLAGIAIALGLVIASGVSAQDHDRRHDDDHNRDRMTRLDPGTVVPVRTKDAIDVDRRDNQVYGGVVDQDVRGQNGRLAIPRGSAVELIVRVTRDNDLVIDLDSVTVNGQRYALKADPNRQESRQDNTLVGAIIGAIQGGQAQGRAVRIPRDSVLTFRLERPLEMGVADRGVMRDGRHYHDYEIYDHHDDD